MIERTLNDELEVVKDLIASYLSDNQPHTLYELIQYLQQPDLAIFKPEALRDSLLLFRSNFLVMHCLYQLQDEWHYKKCWQLSIHALNIQRLPFVEAVYNQSTPAKADPLAAYYLDLSHLKTSKETVEQLLKQFWQLMISPSQYENDLITLELSPPASWHEIQQQYRRLAMQHHPDKGGDREKFQIITAAFHRLKNHFRQKQ